jgi:hypothetical protein
MGHHADPRQQAAMRPETVDRARAIVAVVLIALAPEGVIAAPALDRVQRVLAAAPALAGLPPAWAEELCVLTLRAIAARGPDRLLSDLHPRFSRPLAETALALAVRAALVGGRIEAQTAGILGGLAHWLGVPVATFSDMVEVIGILERPQP